MRTIQEVGSEILSGNPQQFYVFVGEEYGIKMRYIDILKSAYDSTFEYDSVNAVLAMMRKSSLIPTPPSLYIIRYDEEFLSSLDTSSESKIEKTDIRGTVVCIYESKKHTDKVSKYLPNYTVSIDSVSPQYVRKYLRSEFKSLPDNFVDLAIDMSKTYGQAKTVCYSMASIPVSELCKVSKDTLAKILGYEYTASDEQIRLGVAAKDFKFLMSMLDSYEGTADSILYDILATLLELEKLLSSPSSNSDLKEYAKYWTVENIYYMFENTYKELKRFRSLSYSDTFHGVVYLFGLLQFAKVPSPEAME